MNLTTPNILAVDEHSGGRQGKSYGSGGYVSLGAAGGVTSAVFSGTGGGTGFNSTDSVGGAGGWSQSSANAHGSVLDQAAAAVSLAGVPGPSNQRAGRCSVGESGQKFRAAQTAAGWR